MKASNTKRLSMIVSIAAVVVGAAALVSFIIMRNIAAEPKDMQTLFFTFSGIFLVCSLIACFRDFLRFPSMLAYIAATAAFFVFAAGRVDYVAFYVTGDIMGTGLSMAFILTGAFQLLAVILSILNVCVPRDGTCEEKG